MKKFTEAYAEIFEASDRDDLYSKWRKLVNMSPTELQKFMDSEEGKEAGLSKKEASSFGIGRGRDSARAILRLKSKGKENWNETDWNWARRQVSFISRMSKNPGPLYKDGEKTRKLTSLLIWGHNPEK